MVSMAYVVPVKFYRVYYFTRSCKPASPGKPGKPGEQAEQAASCKPGKPSQASCKLVNFTRKICPVNRMWANVKFYRWTTKGTYLSRFLLSTQSSCMTQISTLLEY